MTVTFAIPTLETGRLTLRAPEAGDWPAFHAFFASERSASIGGPIASSDAWRVFSSHAGHWALKGYGWFILHDANGPRGMVGVHCPPHYEAMELGWSLFDGAATGKGYATEAAEAARDWAVATLKPERLVSFIDPANAASQAVARRLGATDTGRPAAHDPGCSVWDHPVATSARDGGTDAA